MLPIDSDTEAPALQLQRVCLHASCGRPAVTRGRCAVHAPADRQDRNRFGALYQTQRWRSFSRRFRAAHPYCARCKGLSDIVDHVVPHRGDKAAFFDGPFEALCRSCHGKKCAAESWR